MKKFLSLIFLNLLLQVFLAHAGIAQNINYDLIYTNLTPIDINYDHNEDPNEINDYSQFIESPYPLIRISQTLRCKNTKISPGYYLLTPKNENNIDFVMFKQKGKIVALIPVYEKRLINPKLVYKSEPKPKVSLIKRPFIAIKKFFGLILKKSKKYQDPPKCAVETEKINGEKYFEIRLYVEEHLYKMLFKTS
ncbi:MAG: hypothetical protein V2B14_05430 [bacterium]